MKCFFIGLHHTVLGDRTIAKKKMHLPYFFHKLNQMFDIRIYILQDISKRESVMDRLLKVLLAGLEFGDEKA